jgi:hypothetical protein
MLTRDDVHRLVDALPEAELETARHVLRALGALHGEELATERPTATEMAALAHDSGAFDWLAGEPDLYALDGGEPVA